MELTGFIADHPTPKIHLGEGMAYTVNSRDYKGVMIVVLNHSESVGSPGESGGGQHRDIPDTEGLRWSRLSVGLHTGEEK